MMIGYMSNFYRHSACWALFLLVFQIATPSARGQQLPTHYFPIMGTNETFRTNFCEIHRQVENREIPLRDSLKGLNLVVGIIDYQLDSETGGIHEANSNNAIGIKILDEIARRAQFEWRDSYAYLDSPNDNQTWDTVLEFGVDTYDFIGEWYLRTTDRLADGIIFPEKWYDGNFIMIQKMEEESDSFQMMSFSTPFTNGVWFLLFATTLISGIVYFSIEYIGCDGEEKEMEVSIRKSVFQSFLNMTGQYVYDPKQPGNRIVAVSMCFLILIILATYTASLASFLVIRNTSGIIINEIQDAIKHDLRICVMRGAPHEFFMRDNYDTARIVTKDSFLDTYLGLDNDDCDVLLTTAGTWKTSKGDIEYNSDCRKDWVGRVVQTNDAAYPMRDSPMFCSSLVRDTISLHLLEMKRDHTYDTIWDSHTAQSTTNNCKEAKDLDDDSDLVAMNVKNIGGIFILHFIAMVAGLASTIYSSYKRKRAAELAGAATTQSSLPTHGPSSLKSARDTTSKTLRGSSLRSSAGAIASVNASISSLEPVEATESANSSDSSLKPAGATTREDGFSADYDLSVTRSHILQMECMESMTKQMKAMQVQLAKLSEEKAE